MRVKDLDGINSLACDSSLLTTKIILSHQPSASDDDNKAFSLQVIEEAQSRDAANKPYNTGVAATVGGAGDRLGFCPGDVLLLLIDSLAIRRWQQHQW